LANVVWLLTKLDLRNLADILLVAAVIYGALWLLRGTQAVQLLRGVILLALIIASIGSIAGLTAFNWLISSGAQALAVVVAIILQPELRRGLERLGRAGGLGRLTGREVVLDRVISEIGSACRRLSERRHGALIVIERETGLQDYVDTGTEIDSQVTSEILQTIFFPNTALHDGAVIVRGARIVAAACVLPLAETIATDTHLGTRHRAGVGITEATDAVSVIVSEETGIISLARNGRIVRHLDEPALVVLLQHLLQPEPSAPRRPARAVVQSKPPKEASTTKS
jgi:diadenylate cyclase